MTAPVFVGRAHELEQLRELLGSAAERRPVTAVLAGEAGVGKSRLLAGFAGQARDKGALVLRGACIELGDGVIPYAPLIEALRLLVREHGEQTVRSLAGPAWSELAGLISDFTDSADAGGSEGLIRGRLHVFGTVLRLLDHLGTNSPVVLIFEDMHWADQSTVDLVSYLTRATSTERVLLLCSHRSRLPAGHAFRALLAEPDFVRRVQRISLSRFNWTELRELVNALGTADRDAVRRVFELSEGNAFFAEQLITAGALIDPRLDRIPESINELMLARISSLSRPANRVMKVAATAARRVSDQLLAAVCGLDDESLDEALRECLDQGMLTVDPADETYSVRHALLRGAVYENMLLRERRRLHTEMAEAITADTALSVADDLSAAVELAHHWYSARRYPEALTAAVHAGGMTARMRAFHESESQYKCALQLWDQVPASERPPDTTRAQILTAAADSARWAGHVKEAVEYVEDALKAVDRSADPRRAGELFERLGSYRWEAGAMSDAHHAYVEAERLLSSSGPPDAVYARVLAALATAQVQNGSYIEGLRLARHAAREAERVGAIAAKGRALNTAGVALTMLDNPVEGERELREALRIAVQVDHLEDMFRAYGNLGVALEHTGNLAGAVDTALAGLQRARSLGLAGTRQGGVLANNAGAALMLLGRWDQAVELLNEVLLDHPPVTQSAYLRLTLAEIEAARGRFEEAEKLVSEVWDHRIADPRFVAALHACEAELNCWRGQPGLALETVNRGLEATDGTENALVRMRLRAVGLRAAADCVRRGDPADTETLEAGVCEQTLSVDGEPRATPELAALTRLCEAERSRLNRTDTAAQWEEVATAWRDLERLYPAAYARWRQAMAAHGAGDAAGAASAARQAAAIAETLRARPLADEIKKMIDTADDTMERKPEQASRRGKPKLSQRQNEIYRKLIDGDSNRVIARALGISEGAIGSHVHRLMKALGVENRAQAVKFAYETHYFDDLEGPAPADG